MLHEEISKQIINAFYTVYNTLGFGFLEKVYENAFVLELLKRGFNVEQQKKIDVYYEKEKVGEYYADICVNDIIILELKTAENIAPEHEAQLIHYLKATTLELGFVFNFGPKPQFIRRIFSNENKKINRA